MYNHYRHILHGPILFCSMHSANYCHVGEVDDIPMDFDFNDNVVIFNSTAINLNRGFVLFLDMVCQRMLSVML